jgi:hypothetical protein
VGSYPRDLFGAWSATVMIVQRRQLTTSFVSIALAGLATQNVLNLDVPLGAIQLPA